MDTADAVGNTAPTGKTTAPREAQSVQQNFPPLWRNRDFMLLWSGQVVSTLGTGIQAIVFPLLILKLTGSPEAAGFAGFLGTIPYVFFSLPAGALVDRWDRKRVMMVCDTFRAINMFSVPLAIFFNVLTVWQLFLVAFIEGSFFVWFNIAEVAAVPRVVDKSQLPNATAQNQAGFATAQAMAPSIGGIIYSLFGAAVPFLLDAISYVVSVTSLFLMRARLQLDRPTTERHLRREIMEGLSWLWNQPLFRFMAFITGGLNFVGFASPLIIIVIAQRMGADSSAIGFLFTISAIGPIIGSAIAGPIAKRLTYGQAIIGVCWIAALLFPLLAFVPQFYFLGLIAGLLSLFYPVFNVVQFSYRVALIPDRLQGRVNSAFRLVAYGFGPAGSALAGLSLGQFGGAPTVLAFGAVQILLAILVTLNPTVRNARRLDYGALEA